jgi:hypothetical protein
MDGHRDGLRCRAEEKYFCLPEIERNVGTKRKNRGNQESRKALKGERKKSMKTALKMNEGHKEKVREK